MSEEMVINPAAEAEEEERLHEQVKVRRDKLAALCEAGKNPYEITKYDWDTKTEEIRERFEELEGKTVRIAGRMMSRRVMGKASFMDLLDSTGRLQVYVRRDDVGEEDYADFKKWDIGDILGWRAPFFAPRRARSPSIPPISCCCPNPFCRCPKSSTACGIPIPGTASAMWISS